MMKRYIQNRGGGAFINMLHSNITCRAECNHDPLLYIHMTNKFLHKQQDMGTKGLKIIRNTCTKKHDRPLLNTHK